MKIGFEYVVSDFYYEAVFYPSIIYYMNSRGTKEVHSQDCSRDDPYRIIHHIIRALLQKEGRTVTIFFIMPTFLANHHYVILICMKLIYLHDISIVVNI